MHVAAGCIEPPSQASVTCNTCSALALVAKPRRHLALAASPTQQRCKTCSSWEQTSNRRIAPHQQPHSLPKPQLHPHTHKDVQKNAAPPPVSMSRCVTFHRDYKEINIDCADNCIIDYRAQLVQHVVKGRRSSRAIPVSSSTTARGC